MRVSDSLVAMLDTVMQREVEGREGKENNVTRAELS